MSLTIKSIGSSSSGNCYQIIRGKGSLLLECGISFEKILKALSHKLSAVNGCLISHEHKDHCKAVDKILKYGINCYMRKETAEASGVSGHRVKIIEPGKQFSIGSWVVMPFDIEHDVPGLGFLISDGEEKLLFATDTAYLRNTFNGLNHIMVECNYSEKILLRNIDKREITRAQFQRIVATHFGLENVVELLKANDLSRVLGIYLLHMSDGNIDEEEALKTIRQMTGKPVYACQK